MTPKEAHPGCVNDHFRGNNWGSLTRISVALSSHLAVIFHEDFEFPGARVSTGLAHMRRRRVLPV